jgi:toxin ParE1/3/4
LTRDVVWSRDALEDVKVQLAFIAADNSDAARRVADALRDAAAALGQSPTGRPGRVTGVYEKSVGGLPYVIAYTTGKKTLAIMRVIRSARD